MYSSRVFSQELYFCVKNDRRDLSRRKQFINALTPLFKAAQTKLCPAAFRAQYIKRLFIHFASQPCKRTAIILHRVTFYLRKSANLAVFLRHRSTAAVKQTTVLRPVWAVLTYHISAAHKPHRSVLALQSVFHRLHIHRKAVTVAFSLKKRQAQQMMKSKLRLSCKHSSLSLQVCLQARC